MWVSLALRKTNRALPSSLTGSLYSMLPRNTGTYGTTSPSKLCAALLFLPPSILCLKTKRGAANSLCGGLLLFVSTILTKNGGETTDVCCVRFNVQRSQLCPLEQYEVCLSGFFKARHSFSAAIPHRRCMASGIWPLVGKLPRRSTD